MQKIKIRKRPHFSSLTIVLLFFTLFIGISATYNVVKLVSYQDKLSKLTVAYNDAKIHKNKLCAELDSYKSSDAYEAFLRNNFGMAKPDEIRVDLIEAEDHQDHLYHYGY